MPTIWYNAQTEKTSEQAGWYLLKDGSRSPHSVYDYEKGIVINDDIYLTLNFPSRKLTSVEAQAFCKVKGGRIPDEYELWQIQCALREIRGALSRITCPVQQIPDDVMSCWSAEKIADGRKSFSFPLLLIDGNRHSPDHSILRYGYFLMVDQQHLFVHQGEEYVPSSLELWALTGDKMLLALHSQKSQVDLFEVAADNKLSHLGNYHHVGQDIFEHVGNFYQYDQGEFRLFCKKDHTYHTLEDDRFRVYYQKTWMSGLSQEMHDDELTIYKRDAQGLWQEAEYHDMSFAKQY